MSRSSAHDVGWSSAIQPRVCSGHVRRRAAACVAAVAAAATTAAPRLPATSSRGTHVWHARCTPSAYDAEFAIDVAQLARGYEAAFAGAVARAWSTDAFLHTLCAGHPSHSHVPAERARLTHAVARVLTLAVAQGWAACVVYVSVTPTGVREVWAERTHEGGDGDGVGS